MQEQKVTKNQNDVAKEFGIAGVSFLGVLLLLPLMVSSLPFYIAARLIKKPKIHMYASVVGSIIFIFCLIYDLKSYLGFVNLLPIDIRFIEDMIGNKINLTNVSFVVYVSGGIFVSYFWNLITIYLRSKKVSSKEDKKREIKNSPLFKKVYDNRFELSVKAQKKWREDLAYNKTDKLLLGINQVGKPYFVDFKEVNQHMFVPATTGGGKTVFLLSYAEYALMKNYPLIFIDGKGSLETVDDVKELCNLYNKDLKVFSDANDLTYNPLKYGNSTVIKDKLEQLVATESGYYTEISVSLIQVMIQFIDAYGFKRDLWNFAEYLDPQKIKDVLNFDLVEVEEENENMQQPKNKAFIDEDEEEEKQGSVAVKKMKKVRSERSNKYYERFFTRYKNSKDGEDYLFIHASSVRTQIFLLLDSELGYLFEEKENGLDLIDISNNKEALFVSFDGLIYDKYIKIMARFLILDLNFLVSYRNRNKMKDQPILAIYDEFSVYANDKIVDTINKSRSGGFHCIIATQTLADLEKVDPLMARQIIGNTNTYAVGQTNHPDEVEILANTFGTYDDIDITTVTEKQEGRIKRIDMKGDKGTVKTVKKFKIPPDEIKSLKKGQFVIYRKASEDEFEPEIIYARHPLKK